MSATGEAAARPPARGEAGTTLIEMLVTMTILASIGMIAFPLLRSGLDSAIFDQAVSGVRADLRIARAQALNSGQRVDLVVAQSGRGYGWTPGPNRALTGGVSMSPAGAALSFYPDGSSSGGTLSLTNGRAQTRLEVDGVTGVQRFAR